MLLHLLLKLILDRNIFVNGILGGNDIDIDEAPYQVNYADVCGGALIHKKWVITTAHCGKADFIRVGDQNRLRGTKVKIFRHIVHPLFGKRHEFDYDVQLLNLRRSLKVTDTVQPIDICDGFCGNFIYVAGWGYPKERGEFHDTLQQVKLKLVQFKNCQNVKQPWYNYTLTQRMFCAGGNKTTDACQGDSGGAAVSDGFLVGVSSFGYGCGRGVPGVYVNVSDTSIRKWIRNYTRH